MKVSVLNIKGKDTGRSIELSKSIFDVPKFQVSDDVIRIESGDELQ